MNMITWADKIEIGESLVISTSAWRRWHGNRGSHSEFRKFDDFGNLWEFVEMKGRRNVIVIKRGKYGE